MPDIRPYVYTAIAELLPEEGRDYTLAFTGQRFHLEGKTPIGKAFVAHCREHLQAKLEKLKADMQNTKPASKEEVVKQLMRGFKPNINIKRGKGNAKKGPTGNKRPKAKNRSCGIKKAQRRAGKNIIRKP